jgi:hypothetical protein
MLFSKIIVDQEQQYTKIDEFYPFSAVFSVLFACNPPKSTIIPEIKVVMFLSFAVDTTIQHPYDAIPVSPVSK